MKPLLQILFFSLFVFSCSNNSNKPKVRKVILVTSPEERIFANFWKEFSLKFNSIDTAAVNKIALDSIWLWSDHISSKEFIKRYYDSYSNSDFLGILDTIKVRYSSIGCIPSPAVKDAIKQQYGDACNCRQVAIIKDTVGDLENAIQFTFLETTKGYLLFGLNYVSFYLKGDNLIDDTTKRAY